jgi:hypothetical protein
MQTNLQVLGLPIQIEWEKLLIGASFFVPVPLGISQQLRKQLTAAAAKYGYDLLIEEVVEKNLTGLRVWRTR